jgi:phosphate transport system substrate-binding protein
MSRFAIMLLSALMALPAWGQEKIVLDGSSGMLPLAQALAKAYQQRSDDLRVELGKGLGTAARLQALAEGKIHIALASHGIKAEEVRKANLKVIEVAKGAIVFAVNANIRMTSITEPQLCDLYSGRIKSWKSLSGSGTPVVVLTRPPTEVDPEVIRAKIGCFKDLREVATARVMARAADMAKGLAESPRAIGMTSMTVVEQSRGRVKALSLNGVTPTAANVRNGRYFLTRDFFFVIKGEPSPAVERFLDFVFSPAGDSVIHANGAVPSRERPAGDSKRVTP